MPTWYIPDGAYLLVHHHRTTLTSILGLFFQVVIVLIHLRKEFIGLLLLAEEQTIEAHPLGTGQRRHLHILCTLHKGNVEIL